MVAAPGACFREEAVLALLLIRVRTRVQVSPSPSPHPKPNQVLVFREEAVLAALLPALFGAWEVRRVTLRVGVKG